MDAPSVLLVARAQTGDRAALDRLLASLQDRLLAYIQTIVRDRDDALDVLQDVLLIVARKLPGLREPRLMRAWAYRIATRQALRHRRVERGWIEAARGDEIDAITADIDEARFDPETIAALPGLVSQLPPACRLVVRMHYVDGLSYDEIAEALDLPLGTVKSRLAYGRGLLSGKLGAG